MPIALLTDFGTRDPYVAAVKGVLASRTDAPVCDLSHEIEPYDILGAAWFLAVVERYWPAGTIFIAVVDPGVGSERRILAAEQGGRIFLAPDNGLLTLICQRDGCRTHTVTSEQLFLPDGSTTFHGRDRFAPVAAALAEGLPLDAVGPAVADIVRLPYTPPRYDRDEIEGTIVAIDRFGNAVTDIERALVPFEPFELLTGRQTIGRLERAYADASPGAFLIAGSTGCLEISVARGSAASELGLARLQRVVLRPRRL